MPAKGDAASIWRGTTKTGYQQGRKVFSTILIHSPRGIFQLFHLPIWQRLDIQHNWFYVTVSSIEVVPKERNVRRCSPGAARLNVRMRSGYLQCPSTAVFEWHHNRKRNALNALNPMGSTRMLHTDSTDFFEIFVTLANALLTWKFYSEGYTLN